MVKNWQCKLTWSQIENIIVLYIPSPISLYIWEEPITYEFKNPVNGAIGEVKNTTNEKNTSNSIFIRNKIICGSGIRTFL